MANTTKVTPIGHQAFSDLIDVFNQAGAEDWNARDLEGFCLGYAEDAIMVTSAGIFKGREAILQAYLAHYPDRWRMGAVSIEVVDIRFAPDDSPKDVLTSMATAIIRCVVTFDGRVTEDGYSMVTFVLDHEANMYIVQDTSNY